MIPLIPRSLKTAYIRVTRSYCLTLFAEKHTGKSRVFGAACRPHAAGSALEAAGREGFAFDEAVLLVGRDQATVRILELPTTDADEIRDIIAIQAGKQTPFPKDQIVYDYKPVAPPSGEYARVFLGIVQKEKIETSCRDAVDGRMVSRVALDSEALAGWEKTLRKDFSGSAYAVVDFEGETADFCVSLEGRVVFTRLLFLEAGSPEETKWAAKFSEEMRFALAAYRAETAGPAVEKIFLHGAFAPDPELARLIEENFSLPSAAAPLVPVELDLTSAAAQSLKVVRSQGHSFAKLLGAAVLSGQPKVLDFTPPAALRDLALRRGKREAVVSAVLALALLGAVFFVVIEKRLALGLRLGSLTQIEHSLVRQLGPLAVADRRVALVRSRLESPVSVVDVMRETRRASPQGIYLSAFSYRRGEAVAVRGTAASAEDIAVFVKRLESSRYFSAVKTQYVTKRKDGDKDVADFEIICGWEGA